MEFKQVQKLHKAIQKQAKKKKYSKSFIRHWNVYYNQLRGRPLSIIEQTSTTTIFPELIQELARQTGQELPLIDCPWAKLNHININWAYLHELKKMEVLINEGSNE